MKMKMKVKGKSSYKPNMPVTGLDKAKRNRKIRHHKQMAADAVGEQIKKDEAVVTSWFSPQKYKGFKTNYK